MARAGEAGTCPIQSRPRGRVPWSRSLLEAGDEEFELSTKGLEDDPHAPLDVAYGFLEGIDLAEMKLQEEAVMAGGPAPRRASTSFSRLALRRPLVRSTSRCRIRLSSNQALEDGPATHTDDVRDHPGDLDVGVFECFVDALGVLDDLPCQLLPGTGQIPHLLDREQEERSCHESAREPEDRRSTWRRSRRSSDRAHGGHGSHWRGSAPTNPRECARPASSKHRWTPWPHGYSPRNPASPKEPGVRRVVVPKVRTSWVTRPPSAIRTQATTVSLCTSKPAALGTRTSMTLTSRVAPARDLRSATV